MDTASNLSSLIKWPCGVFLVTNSVLITQSFQEPEIIGSESLNHASYSNFYLNHHHLAKFIQI